MANNRFGKKIILLNKKKVCFFTNVKSDKFLWKIVALNVLSLLAYKEAISQTTGITSYGNCHYFITKLLDISVLMKYITDNSIFNKKLSHTGIQNNTIISAFLDLFYIRATYLLNNITLTRYVNFIYDNWDNYNQNNNITTNTANNNGPKSEPEDSN